MGKKLYVKEIMSKAEIEKMIKAAVHAAKQEVYAEIADSLKEAGERDYEYASMNTLAGKAGCALAGERISWLVEHESQIAMKLTTEEK